MQRRTNSHDEKHRNAMLLGENLGENFRLERVQRHTTCRATARRDCHRVTTAHVSRALDWITGRPLSLHYSVFTGCL